MLQRRLDIKLSVELLSIYIMLCSELNLTWVQYKKEICHRIRHG